MGIKKCSRSLALCSITRCRQIKWIIPILKWTRIFLTGISSGLLKLTSQNTLDLPYIVYTGLWVFSFFIKALYYCEKLFTCLITAYDLFSYLLFWNKTLSLLKTIHGLLVYELFINTTGHIFFESPF